MTFRRQTAPSANILARSRGKGARPVTSQCGFSLVSAIFLLVVLTVLGAAIMRLSTTQSISSAQDVQGSRAYHAARAGIEWAVYQVMSPDINPTVLSDCPSATNMTIDGFTVTVQCARSPAFPNNFQEAGTIRSIAVYQLTSTANSGGAVGSVGYVERQIQVRVSKCVTTETGAATLCS